MYYLVVIVCILEIPHQVRNEDSGSLIAGLTRNLMRFRLGGRNEASLSVASAFAAPSQAFGKPKGVAWVCQVLAISLKGVA